MSFLKKYTGCLLAGGSLVFMATIAGAGFVEAEGVQKKNADPSPAASDSQINNYVNQDEQINIEPEDGLVKVLRTNQKNLVNDFVTITVPLRNVHPREIRNVFRQVTGLEGGRAEVIRDKLSKENFMQLMIPRDLVDAYIEATRALDQPWVEEYNDGSTDIYIKLQHRPADIVNFIAQNYAGEGFSEIDTTNNAIRRLDEPYRAEKFAGAVQALDVPPHQVDLEVKVYEITARDDFKLGVDYINWSNGPGRNLWTFAEGGYSAEQRARGLTSIFDPFLNAGMLAPVDKTGVLDTAAVESYRAVNYLVTSCYIDFLEAKGQARVVSSQVLSVKSGRTGVISTEDRILSFVNNMNEIDEIAPNRFTNGQWVFLTRANGELRMIGEDEYREFPEDAREMTGVWALFDRSDVEDAVRMYDSDRRVHYESAGTVGMRLEMTPYVGMESMELDLEMTIGELNGLAPNGTPIINRRRIDTTVRLLDGEPFVVSSLKQNRQIEGSGRAPLLGDLPIAGYLFGGEDNINRRKDMVITMTPSFHLHTESQLATAPRVETMAKIVADEAPLDLPASQIGYDQWLLDAEK